MPSIEQLQEIVNKFDGLTKGQQEEVTLIFMEIIETITDETVKIFFQNFLDFLQEK